MLKMNVHMARFLPYRHINIILPADRLSATGRHHKEMKGLLPEKRAAAALSSRLFSP